MITLLTRVRWSWVLGTIALCLGLATSSQADLFIFPTGPGGTWNIYEAVDTPADWNAANTAAQAKTDPLFGTPTTGNLIRINSAEENAVVTRMIGSTSYWIGAHDQATEGDWNWTSGSPSLFWRGAAGGSSQNGLYANWNAGEPNNSGGDPGEDAAEIYAGTGGWNDLSVTTALPYIVHYATGATLVNAATAGAMILNPANGRYYQANSTPMTWADAKAVAESRQFQSVQGKLVQVDDVRENGFVQTLARDSGGEAWLGLTDEERFGGSESIGTANPQVNGWVWSGPSDTNGSYQNVPLSSTGYTNWNAGEPNGTAEDQAQIISGTGQWNDLSGTNTLRSVIEYEHAPLARNFAVREVKMNGAMTMDVSAMRNLLNGQSPKLSEVTGMYAAVNFRDPNDSGGGSFLGRAPFPGETPVVDDNNFAVRAQTSIVIPTAGDWTFAVGRDDIFELVVDRGTDAAVSNSGTCCDTTLTTVNFAQPGTYAVTALFGELGGGAYFDLSAAPGAKTSFDGDFRLVGDTLNGGLATAPARQIGVIPTKWFTVRRVSSTGGVGDLATVDNLLDNGLPGIASEATETFETVNFLSTGGNGHFGEDAAFPGFTINNDDNNFAVEATGTLRVPLGSGGWWTFGVNSDDGFRLTIADEQGAVIPFASTAGQSGTTIQDGSLVYPSGRGVDDSLGAIYLPAGLYDLNFRYWEGGGGAAVELFTAAGIHTSFDGSFTLLSSIAVPEPSSLALCLLGGLATIALCGATRRRRLHC
jgi:hypothetical protein